MDESAWQWAIVAAVVLASAVYVGLRVWRVLRPPRSDTECGGCHGCAPKPLVGLQLPEPRSTGTREAPN